MQDNSYFEFVLPTKLVFQSGAAAEIAPVAERLGMRRPFVVADKVLLGLGLVSRVTGGFTPAGIFTDVPQDSDVETCDRAAALMKESEADGIIAVGGGSVLDTAKGTNIVFSRGGKLVDHQGVGVLDGKLEPFIAVPTTAGTGSEVSRIAAVKDPAQHQKLFFESPALAADVAILDPEVTASMPPKLTASTGMDAMTHAVESLLATNASPLTDAWALYAMKTIFTWLPRAVKGEIEARGPMLLAAAAAGAAFSNAGVGVVHACAHGLGALKGVPHGVANSIMLPHGIAFNLETLPAKRQALGGNLVERLSTLAHACGLPPRLRDVGVREDDLEALADYASSDGALIYNPREATRDELLRLFKNAY